MGSGKQGPCIEREGKIGMTLYPSDIVLFVSIVPAVILAYYFVRGLSPVHNGVRHISGKFVAMTSLIFWFLIAMGIGYIFDI